VITKDRKVVTHSMNLYRALYQQYPDGFWF